MFSVFEDEDAHKVDQKWIDLRLKEIGAAFKVMRKKKGFTQKEIALKVDVKKDVVISIEKGRNYTVKTLLKLCEGLGCIPRFHFPAPVRETKKIPRK